MQKIQISFTPIEICTLFCGLNNELAINEWFVANKPSLNINKKVFFFINLIGRRKPSKKNKDSFFHKDSKKENTLLQLPNLTIINHKIKREESIKFLGFLLDENLIWKENLEYIENRCAKNIGLLHKVKHHLNKKCLLHLYYSHVHTCMNYANIATHIYYAYISQAWNYFTVTKSIQYALCIIMPNLKLLTTCPQIKKLSLEYQ